jgi:hypothetical protein
MKHVEIYSSCDTLGSQPLALSIEMKLFKWSSFTVLQEKQWTFEMPQNSVKLVNEIDIYTILYQAHLSPKEHVAEFILSETESGKLLAREYIFPELIKDITGVGHDNVEVSETNDPILQNKWTISFL